MLVRHIPIIMSIVFLWVDLRIRKSCDIFAGDKAKNRQQWLSGMLDFNIHNSFHLSLSIW